MDLAQAVEEVQSVFNLRSPTNPNVVLSALVEVIRVSPRQKY